MVKDPLLELGKKHRSGTVLSNYIRAIATEKTERVDVIISADKVEKKLVSKAEAMARDIWKKALESPDSKEMLEYRKLILDRAEGKPNVHGSDEEKQKRASIPDKISEINKHRLNRYAEEKV